MSRELTPEQVARLREILGSAPPTEVYDPTFHEAYQKVVDTDPELALAWQESLTEEVREGPKVKLPMEAKAGAARRAASFRSFLGKVSTRQVEEEDSPTPVMPDQRKLTVTVFGVVFLVAFLLIMGVFLFPSNKGSGTQVVDETPEPDPSPTLELPVVEVTPPPTPPVTPVTPPAANPGPNITPPTPAITPPPVVTNATTDIPDAPEMHLPTGGTVYTAPTSQASLETGVQRQVATEPTGTVIYTDTPGTGSIITPTSAQATLASVGASPVVFTEDEPPSQVLFGARDDLSQNSTFIHTSDYRPAATGSLIFERTQEEEPIATPQQATRPPMAINVPAPVDAPSAPTSSPAALADALTAAATPTPPARPAPSAPAASQSQAELPAPQPSGAPIALQRPDGTTFQLAERIPAVLVTSATILDGIPAPVIAETRGEWCNATNCPTYSFVGTARMLGGNRVIINFDRAVTPTGVQPIEAIALSAEYTTSIPATIRDETPTIAPDLVRASLNGVAAYADRMSSATRTTIDSSGNMVQEDILPDLTSLIAGNAARALGLPESATTVVRLAELEPGTPVIITIGLTY